MPSWKKYWCALARARRCAGVHWQGPGDGLMSLVKIEEAG